MNISDLHPTIRDQALAAARGYNETLDVVGRHALDQRGIAVGRHVRNPETGFVYRVEGIRRVEVWEDEVTVTLVARRHFLTDREDAEEESFISLDDVQAHTPDAEGEQPPVDNAGEEE